MGFNPPTPGFSSLLLSPHVRHLALHSSSQQPGQTSKIDRSNFADFADFAIYNL
jgi:hypothetical protein